MLREVDIRSITLRKLKFMAVLSSITLLSWPHVVGADETTVAVPPKPTVSVATLKACASSPNCVSSIDERGYFRVEPFKLKTADKSAAWEQIHATVSKIEGFKSTDSTNVYQHYESTSNIFHFVDDVELFLDAEKGLVKLRSASRTGYYDLGANRRRMSGIAEILRAENLIE